MLRSAPLFAAWCAADPVACGLKKPGPGSAKHREDALHRGNEIKPSAQSLCGAQEMSESQILDA
jgi:hypothetical protein